MPGVLMDVNGHHDVTELATLDGYPAATIAVVGKGAAAIDAVDRFFRNGHHAVLASPYHVSPAEASQPGATESAIRGVDHELMVAQAAGRASFVWICTPTVFEHFTPDHIRDLEKLAASLRAVALPSKVIVVVASLLPVGTGDWLQLLLGDGFHVVACPPVEHGAAFPGGLNPRLVVGADDPVIARKVRELFGLQAEDSVVTGRREAEMIGYALSSLSALRHSAAEELASIARGVGADVRTVLTTVGMDRRATSRSGKDMAGYRAHLRTLLDVAESGRVETPVLSAAKRYQAGGQALLTRILAVVRSPVGKSIAFWGLDLKADADERDGSAVLHAARILAASGARVTIWEPSRQDWNRTHLDGVVFVADREGATSAADVVVVAEGIAHTSEDFLMARRLMAGSDVVVVSGELDSALVEAAGLRLYAPARAASLSNGHGLQHVTGSDVHETVHANGTNGRIGPDPSHSAIGAGIPPMTHDIVTGRALLAGMPESAVEAAGPRRRPARRSATYESVKRSLDLVVGSAAVVVGAPIFALVALAILLDDGRPVFFKAERIGQGARPIPMYKFRTMRKDAPRFANKTTVGTYVTRTGTWLRRFGLDELPQAWNLIRGDMTLVGPRPEQPHIVQWYQAWQEERLAVKPGITGWWQIRMRGSSAEMYRNVELDIWYVRHRSLLLDLEILLRTPAALFKGGRA